MAWIEFYRILPQQSDVPAAEPTPAIASSPPANQEFLANAHSGDTATEGTLSEPTTNEEKNMANDQQLVNGHTKNDETEEDYVALARIVGIDAKAAARLDDMSAEEVEEFIDEIEYREETLDDIDRAKRKLVRLANQKRKLKMADEAPRCEHIKSNGQQCGSPAIKDTQLCYFHGETRKQRESEAAAKVADLPVLEDMHSLQLAVMRVCGLLATKAIEEKTARVLFDGLRLAQRTLSEHKL